MAALNPMQLMMMLKGGNPQAVAQQIIQQNFPNNPQMQNLLQLGRNGDVKQLEQIATQMLGSQGRNFSAEFQSLMDAVKHL